MSLNRTVSDLQSRLRRPRRMKRLRGRVVAGFLDLNQRVWQRLPALVRDASPVRKYGAHLHAVVSRHADREMYLGTLFLRNRPALELMRRLVEKRDSGSRLRVAVLGCSIGVEVYSILWILRSARPDLEIVVHAVDVSSEVLDVARRGAYSPEASDMVHASIFERLTKAEAQEMFDWSGQEGRIKPWLREGVTWQLGDASDPKLVDVLGSQDIVVANNFLCHMDAPDAESACATWSNS